ncbi:GDSL-type esterase/lipase family protein [uncultured Agathobaculum sp.]|uniref:GDSL-type esterase/lipase family protein n=1 Tax=uncultured Agathobaculum sp. TaxID=2048140 RepID=UPI003207A671
MEMRTQSMLAGVLAALCLTGCSGRTQAGEQTQLSNGGTGQAQTQRTAFADTALVGNSYIDSFYTYDAMPEASYYYRVGLNVNSVFDQPMLLGEDTETPVIERLQEQDFAHIIFFFGENELGWTNRTAFTEEYTKVIETARSYCPDAVIYLSAIPPVSEEASEKNEDNTNNASIQACNAEIEQIAEENGAVYVDAFSALADENGCLPADAAADGIHPAKEYTEKWAELLKESIAEAEEK